MDQIFEENFERIFGKHNRPKEINTVNGKIQITIQGPEYTRTFVLNHELIVKLLRCSTSVQFRNLLRNEFNCTPAESLSLYNILMED